MRAPTDLLLRRRELVPSLPNERVQLGVEISAQVDQRRQRALPEVGMCRGRNTRDAHARRTDGRLQIGVVALVALEGAALAHLPDVRPLVHRVDCVLDQVGPQPHARVELVLDLVQRRAALLEDDVVVDDRHCQASASLLPGRSLRRTPRRYALMNGSRSPSSTASGFPLSTPVRTSLTMRYGAST